MSVLEAASFREEDSLQDEYAKALTIVSGHDLPQLKYSPRDIQDIGHN